MRCKTHGGVEATRQCTSCSAGWCGDCAQTVGIRQACPDCGHVLATADAEVHGLADSLRDVSQRLVTLEGLTTIGALSVFYAVLAFSRFAIFLYLSTLVIYYFAIVRHVGEGKDGMPGPTEDELGRTVSFAFRGLFCAAIAFAPALAYVGLSSEHDTVTLLALVVLGQTYLPAAVIAIALSDNTLAALWPVAWVKVIARAPSSYLRFVGLWICSFAIGAGLEAATMVMLDDNVFGFFAQAMVWTAFWFAQAVLVGHYIRENRTAYGWD
jgi:hypothetical protein